MSKQRILMIVALCFVLIGTVAAGIPHDQRHGPNSIVTCEGDDGDYFVANRSTPRFFGLTECSAGREDPFVRDRCARCIRSLEREGCEVGDVVVTNGGSTATGAGGASRPRATFLLSCGKP